MPISAGYYLRLSLDGILVHCRLLPSILSSCPKAICWFPFIHLGEVIKTKIKSSQYTNSRIRHMIDFLKCENLCKDLDLCSFLIHEVFVEMFQPHL